MWNIDVYKSGNEVWVYQVAPTHERVFLARFKYAKPMANARHFVKFLTKNFTVDEYLDEINDKSKGVSYCTPLEILKRKGFVSLNALKLGKK